MKKEAGIIRHPHYPEIIKFKIGSLKTTSTLSTSNWDEDLIEKFSLQGEGYQNNVENISNQGDADMGLGNSLKKGVCF